MPENRYFLVFAVTILLILSFSQGCLRGYYTPAPPTPSVQTLNIGETATQGNLRITVLSYTFQDTINGFAPGPDHPDSHWLILDMTAENLDKTREVSLWPAEWDPPWAVTDSGGYTYHAYGYSGLEHSFDGTHILPGETRRGNALVAVPRNATGLTFRYNFGGGNIALFHLE